VPLGYAMIPLTMRLRNIRLAIVLTALLVRSELVSADPTPAPASGEACTIESQQRPGEECLMCGVMQSDPAKCLKRLANKGYTRRCRGEGTVQWMELWCRAAQPGGSAPPAK
jgi:hypothetical protein